MILTYGQLGIFDENKKIIGIKLNDGKEFMGSKEDIRKMKTNDFKLFSRYIYKNKLAQIPYYDEKMLDYAKDLDWLNLQKSDILEATKYLDDMANFKIELDLNSPYYSIFSNDLMERHVEKCVEFVEKKL